MALLEHEWDAISEAIRLAGPASPIVNALRLWFQKEQEDSARTARAPGWTPEERSYQCGYAAAAADTAAALEQFLKGVPEAPKPIKPREPGRPTEAGRR
jgi:hypothetical protein